MNGNSPGKAKRLTGQHCSTLLLVVSLLLSLPACASISSRDRASSSLPPTSTTLTLWVESSLSTLHPDYKPRHTELLGHLYRQAAFGHFWINEQGHPNAAARLLLNDLQPWLALEDHPRLADYRKLAELLQQSVETSLPRHRQARDLLITDLFFSYQQDLLQRYWTQYDSDQDHGITNAYERWDNWPDEVVKRSLQDVFPRWLQQLQGHQPQDWAMDRIRENQPTSRFYQPWRQAFAELQEMAEAGDWPELNRRLQRGDEGPMVARLAEQLYRLGDLSNQQPYLLSKEGPLIFDQRLELALKTFQKRHNLPQTGVTDQPTRDWLNMQPQERMRRLAHNIRRLHHLPNQLNDRYIMVNLADARLQFVESQQVKLDMKVIIGRDGQRTPIMNQWLTSLVINPLWNVPPSIARERIFPRALNNPEYLASRDYALVQGWHTPSRFVSFEELPDDAFTNDNSTYRIVQKAGNFNQLGRAKFRLSNQQAIYLHDTPYRNLFSSDRRDISAGCVRVEDSERLVEALLASSQTWTPEVLKEMYAQGDERYLQVRPRVAVYLMYWTVWTDTNGRLQWRDDIYHKDGFKQPGQRLALGP
ncbi:L,D-transpeptidase family protein [Marinospirillum alkaliphilum]|uniref:Murein L,D-transpeptidase YcbB/YkuD n=1 Tax=Marinospirillum alkaliphilum DSM 21637 TaxID=1122209 RepID=A0A1K1W0D5_9GAMM|nr:L,D-transpeptidase family protein [Marinospirillum alkaliphilum]SFX30878.1 Murein L,D-transpeptidase YcbB/YkuD [Marinospirillum alkaliphilum DSM 21637]